MPRFQIATDVSEETKRRLEQFTEPRGLKKGFVMEQALLFHLQALQELPANLIIPPKLMASAEASAQIAALLEDSPAPTAAMEALMAGDYSQIADDELA